MQNNELKNYKDEIRFFLDNPGKYDHVSFTEETYKSNVEAMFPTIFDENNPADPSETAAYLCGKACEINILKVVRPEFKSVFLSRKEVITGITFNLPHHLEDIALEIMDSCEDAVSEFIADKNPDIKQVLLDIQFIAEHMVKIHKLYDIEPEGYKNSEIAFPSELYIYANNIALKALADKGYKILGTSDNFNAPVSVVLDKPDHERIAVLEQVTIAPKTAKFTQAKVIDLKAYAEKERINPYCLGIMVEPEDENDRSKGIVVKGKRAQIKLTDFIPASK